MSCFRFVPYNLEIINLGSTFAKYGFDYSYYGLNGFNFADAPQPLYKDYILLKKYINHIQEGAIVIIVAVCPFEFSLLKYDSNQRFKRLIYKIKHIIKLIIHYNKIADSQNSLSPDQLSIRNAEDRIAGWKKEFNLTNVINPVVSEELKNSFNKTTNILKNILNLCREKKLNPVIINMPAAKCLYSRFSEDFIKEFYNDNIERGNILNAPVFNYFGDSRFDDIMLYENYVDCLNDKGRKLFSEVLKNDLNRIGLWSV